MGVSGWNKNRKMGVSGRNKNRKMGVREWAEQEQENGRA
ncbi:hypothetical protein Pcinc_037175, partial [Petrolisthes cinctipes]